MCIRCSDSEFCLAWLFWTYRDRSFARSCDLYHSFGWSSLWLAELSSCAMMLRYSTLHLWQSPGLVCDGFGLKSVIVNQIIVHCFGVFHCPFCRCASLGISIGWTARYQQTKDCCGLYYSVSDYNFIFRCSLIVSVALLWAVLLLVTLLDCAVHFTHCYSCSLSLSSCCAYGP